MTEDWRQDMESEKVEGKYMYIRPKRKSGPPDRQQRLTPSHIFKLSNNTARECAFMQAMSHTFGPRWIR